MEKKEAPEVGTGEVSGHEDATKFHKMPKPGRLPANIIQPASFLDTLAVLSLFMHMPSWLMISIHMLYLASYFSSSKFSIFSARSMLGWSISGSAKGNSSSTSLSGVAFLSAVVRVIGIDFAIAVTTLYLAPLLRNVVMILAHAVVAASLGGGPKVFTNAVYSTTLIEVAYFVWEKLSQRSLLPSDMSSAESSHPHHHGHVLHPELDGLLIPSGGDASFNTITSTWTSLSNIVRFIRHMDWVSEVPLICFQLVAVHVVGLCLLPYVRNVLHENRSTTESGSVADGSPSSESYVDSTFIRTLGNIGELQSSVSPAPPAPTSDIPQGPSIEIAVPSDVGATATAFADGEEVEAEDKYTSDFDFLYAPAGKKNKRLAMIRANQPLWSTLASSIVLAARQESGYAAEDSSSVHCYIRFLLDNLAAFLIDGDVSDSLIVRVNGIQWPQICLYSSDDSGHEIEDDKGGEPPHDPSRQRRCIMVVIYGLAPLTQYEIMISASDSAQVVMQTSISTTANSAAGSSIGAPLARSVSPVTTLLDTLASTQVTLSEEKSRLKRSRKEHAKRLASLRSDIDSIRSKIDAADKGDARNRRKVLSLREAVRQLEEEVTQLTKATKALEGQQASSADEFRALEGEWKEHLQAFREKEAVVQDVRSGWDKKITSLESEFIAINAKCEKLTSKKQRLNNELQRIYSETADIASKDVERRRTDRELKLERRRKLEEEFSISITKMEQRASELKALPIYNTASEHQHQPSL
jgi:predicted  nucleic acid-binding Zn-ribbon protein